MKYKILCCVEKIIATGNGFEVEVKGDEGYFLKKKDRPLYNCYWSEKEEIEKIEKKEEIKEMKIFIQTKTIVIKKECLKLVELSYLHRKKIELKVEIGINKNLVANSVCLH